MTPMPPKEKGYLWLGLSSVFFLLAAVSYASHPHPSTLAGRLALIHNAFSSLFGSWSEVVLFSVLGCIGIVIAVTEFKAVSRNAVCRSEKP